MARLPEGFMRAYDSQGVSAPGALLYVYTAGTTTPVATFSNIGMTTANTHPVVADASGAFGDIYVRTGTYKVRVTSAAGVELPGSPTDNVAASANFGALIVPQMFGAVGDGATDDSAAINLWAAHLRSERVRGDWPGGTYFCGTTTLHLGQCTIRGAGAPGNNRWVGSMTNVVSNANPIATNTNGVANTAFGRCDIENVIFAGAGGTVATINLWDKVGYTGQIGMRLGYLTMVADAGVAEDGGDDFSQGFGTNRIVNCNFQDISGWGMYLHKSWGDSIIMDCTFRCCGGKAAYDYGVSLGDADEGDYMGGAICTASSTVDTEFVRVHTLGSGYTSGSTLNNANYDDRGTAFRIGAKKSDTDPLFRDYLTANKVNFNACHNEGYVNAFVIFGTKWTCIHSHNSNGGASLYGRFVLGWAANPSTDTRLQMTSTRVGSAIEVLVAQGTQVSLGEWINATPGGVTPIKYWVPCTGEFNGSLFHADDLTAVGFSLEPQEDPTTAPGGSGITNETTWLPFIRTNALPTPVSANLLPSFNGGAGTALTGWTLAGGGAEEGTATVSESGGAIALTNEKTAIYEVTGLTAGDLVTLQFWVDWTGDLGLGSVIFEMTDGSGVVAFTRFLGSSVITNGAYYRCVQSNVPADGTLRLKLRNGGTTTANFRAPILQVGTAKPLGKQRPARWIAADGNFSTT